MRAKLTETLEVGAKILHVDGEIDLSNCARLRTDIERLASHGPGRLIVDLSACTYIDSSGLAALLHAAGRSRDFVIVARDSAPREVLHTTAIDQTVPVFETVESARPAESPAS